MASQLMKYNSTGIEFDKLILRSNLMSSLLIEEQLKFHYFLYESPDPDFFKIVFNWQVTIHYRPEVHMPLAEIEAEEQFIFKLNNRSGSYKGELENLLMQSYRSLQQVFSEKTRDSSWNRYQFLPFDCKAAANKLFVVIENTRGTS
jgi:hypothetical protein